MTDNMIKIPVIAAFIALAAGCGKPTADYFGIEHPEIYSKVYISKAFGGPVNCYLQVPSDSTVSFFANFGGLKTLEEDITLTLDIESSKVKDYNGENNTSYVLLPANCYSLENETVTIRKGETRSEAVRIRLMSEKMPGKGPFVLPVSIVHVSDSRIEINPELNTMYFVVSGILSSNPFTYLDRSGWKVLSCSSFNNTAQERTPPELMLDGKNETWWGTEFSPNRVSPPHIFVIDMMSSELLHGFHFRGRNDSNGNLSTNGQVKRATVHVSDDNQFWKPAGTYNLPYTLDTFAYFTNYISGRYVKVSVDRCYNGAANEFYQAAVSEFNLF